MLAKGPPWTNAGMFSVVPTRFGMRASRSSASNAPVAEMDLAVTGVAIVGEGKQRAIDAFPQIFLVLSQAQHGHYLGSSGYVESRLAGHSLPSSAQTDNHVS